MGLFDWLSDAVGSDMGGGGTPMAPGPGATMPDVNPLGDPTGGRIPMPTAAPAATGPMPPPQMAGADAPPLPFPPGADPMTAGGTPPNGPGLPMPPGSDPMTAGGTPPNGPGLPPSPPPPLPVARPMMPPNAAPTAGALPPSPPMSLAPTGAAAPPVAAPMRPGETALGRALGINPNQAKEVASGMGAGLTAAGNSRGKSKFQAFSSGAGASIEGADKRSDKTEDKQSKYLTQAIAAANAGDTRALNQARTKLALAQAEVASTGKSKESIVNSEQQLYLRAQSAAAQDGRLKALKTQADQASTQFGPESPQAKAAIKAHKDAYDATVQGHLSSLGLDPKKAESIGKQPGMSPDNPLKVKTNDDLAKAQPGQIVQLPDGSVMRKKAPDAAAPAAAPAAGGGNAPEAVPPVPVTAPAGSRADTKDDEDD